MTVIDVSKWQGKIDWNSVAESGVEGAILRCTSGRSNSMDSQFLRNLRECEKLSLPIGVYRYGYATTVAEAKKEAEAVVDAIKGHKLPLKVWYDAEDEVQRKLPKATLTAIIKAFDAIITDAGFDFGIYCNQHWYKNVLDVEKFACPFWIAKYGRNTGKISGSMPEISHKLFGWQYTSKGKVNGIDGYVDMNEIYDWNEEQTKDQKPTKKEKIAAAESFDKTISKKYRVTANLNFRTGPSMEHDVQAVLPMGTECRCYGYYTGSWYLVIADGVTGWVHSSYLAKV